MRRLAIGLGAVVILLLPGVSSANSQHGKLGIRPKRSHVDQPITASYRIGKQLPRGWHYEFSLLAHTPANLNSCVGYENKTRNTRPRKGQTIRVTFLTTDDPTAHTGADWCQGAAELIVTRERDGDTGGNSGSILALLDFRFYGLP